MQFGNYLYIVTGAVIAGLGLRGYLSVPRLYAKHAADIASRVPVIGQVVEYELDQEDNRYTRIVEYEVDGHRYRIRGWDTIGEKGEPMAPVRLAYRRDLRSDAIEVEREFSGDKLLGMIGMGTGVVLILAGVFG